MNKTAKNSNGKKYRAWKKIVRVNQYDPRRRMRIKARRLLMRADCAGCEVYSYCAKRIWTMRGGIH